MMSTNERRTKVIITDLNKMTLRELVSLCTASDFALIINDGQINGLSLGEGENENA